MPLVSCLCQVSVAPTPCAVCLPQGDTKTTDYRMFLTAEGDEVVSPWHDLHLKNDDGTFNFVCEIPKNTSAKMEVATVRPLHSAPEHSATTPPAHLAASPSCHFGQRRPAACLEL